MDHLHNLPSATFEFPPIYYRGTRYEPLQGEDLCLSLKSAIDSAPSSDDNKIARVQTLLYFGMLTEVLGSTIIFEDYIKHDAEGRSILTTAQLEYDTKRKFKSLKRIRDLSRKTEALARMVTCVRQVQNIVEEKPYCDRVTTLLDEDFILAVQCLGGSLAYAILHCAEANKISNHDNYRDWHVIWYPQNAWLSKRMLANGWCPNEVERFARTIWSLTQFCAVGLPPSADQKDHSACTRFVCEANNVKEQYIPSHTDDCAISSRPCAFENGHIKDVMRILRDGGLPLIEIRRNGNGVLELRAVRHRLGRRFVAISHVWSDGMGNKDKNEMRTCQLTRIWERARLLLRDNSQITLSTDNRVNFFVLGFAYLTHSTRNLLDIDRTAVTIWMDTLCIPLEPREMRSLAIKGMRSAYEKACKVLILDSELSCIDHTNDLESLMRIQYRSGWIRRLWTLNEGIYSQERLFVCFNNCIVRVPGMADKLMVADGRGHFPFYTKPVAFDIYAPWVGRYRLVAYSLPARRFERAFFFDKPYPLGKLINSVWDTVVERTTSTESDRPILIMSLLGLDLSPILDIPPVVDGSATKGAIKRMRAVYKALPEFPQEIIFQNGKRFEEYGMRWATIYCRKWVANDQAQKMIYGDPGKILPEGLCVNYPALLTTTHHDQWILSIGLWMQYSHRGNLSALAAVRPDNGNELEHVCLDNHTQIGFLIESDWGLDGVIRGTRKHVLAIVVSVLEESFGIRYCKFLGRMTIERLPYNEGDLIGSCDTTYISKNETTWCVG
ncbi:hypothetical protein BDZ45DRAFT_811120 [Acephala macrosclerotiorum]|nr:hypothetical protein BDZ45DRAFT_811120 [Acephala macrosclerotiorum]